MSRASWPVTTEVVSSSPAIAFPCRAAERVPSMPMAATAITSERAKERYQRDGRSPSKRRIHLYVTRQASHKAFTLLIIMAIG